VANGIEHGFMVAIDLYGGVWTCGDNEFGQVGLGRISLECIRIPKNIWNGAPAILVSVGATHFAFVTGIFSIVK
jgi:hypothetical protein